jgi:antitoxin ParD1/3/4
MSTMNISLPQAMKAFVEEQAAREGYGTVSEYLRALIRDVQKRKQAKAKLDAKLLEGARSSRERMTAKRWAALEDKIRKKSPGRK